MTGHTNFYSVRLKCEQKFGSERHQHACSMGTEELRRCMPSVIFFHQSDVNGNSSPKWSSPEWKEKILKLDIWLLHKRIHIERVLAQPQVHVAVNVLARAHVGSFEGLHMANEVLAISDYITSLPEASSTFAHHTKDDSLSLLQKIEENVNNVFHCHYIAIISCFQYH